MDEHTCSGHDHDRGRDHDIVTNTLARQHPTSPPALPPPLLLDRPAMQAISTPIPLPPLPESPLATTSPASVPRTTGFQSYSGSPSSSSSTSNTAKVTRSEPPSVRTVTPEPMEKRKAAPLDPLDTSGPNTGAPVPVIRPFGSMSPQTSPRSIPGASSTLSHHSSTGSRRQGVVFSDAVAGSFDSTSSSPPPRPASYRVRTHTMDGASPFRDFQTPGIASEPRHRVFSCSSAGSGDNQRGPALMQSPFESLGFPSITPYRSAEPPPTMPAAIAALTASSSATSVMSIGTIMPIMPVASVPAKEKKSNRRLTKRTSRPTSPIVSAPPSVDSLPVPMPTDDANKVLMLMKTLCGRMRGEIEYRDSDDGPWSQGICYIEEEKGCLMFDAGKQGLFQTAIVSDLRGCRIWPVRQPGTNIRYLALSNAHTSAEIALRPMVSAEFDLWLAALLCWQQLSPAPGATSPTMPWASGSRSVASPTSDPKSRGPNGKPKDGAIIKVGKVLFWDKGIATSPRAIVKRPSTRDLRSSQSAWRRVSCILQGNGEFKLMTENDVTILSVIELTQLARCAIQQLDKSVLDEEYCIAIFPIYATTSTHLSIFRPVYIALDSRVAFEVWAVLLWAFAVPDIYAIDKTNDDVFYEVAAAHMEDNIGEQQHYQLFRLEKSLRLRITEAKIKTRGSADVISSSVDRHERQGKGEPTDPLVGNYLAEVILDGEVRARTTVKTDTKNPFWREDCEFSYLPPVLPYLSVVLKRVEGNLDSHTHQLQASLGLPKSGNVKELMYGAVDIPLNNLERGREHEQWLPIYDDRPQAIGSMLVKVHHEELAVLAEQQYKPLLDLLHNFSSGLTLQIASVLPGSLRRIAEVLLNTFQVTGKVSDWIMAMVEDEIDGIGNQVTMKKIRFSKRLRSSDSIESASDRDQIVRDMGRSLQGEANLLFRGNSLLTQALEFHMRRLGHEYLEEVLSDKIFEINEINPDCEVDPGKINPGDDINKHWDRLMQLTTEVWTCITSSATRFPAELRHILKYIRAVAEDRYGDFLRTVSYTSVSGFLFLRFVCPAILNPKLFGLLRDHPRPRAQRTLTLIAKGLQALANMTMIGRKETWMEPMNRFLGAQKQSVRDFIDVICSIPAEKSNTPVVLPPSYSTPVTIMGRLSSVAQEGFPRLPYLIDLPRNLAALAKVWTDAHPPSAPSSHFFDGELEEFNVICLELQTKSDECFARADSLRQAPETSSQTTEDALVDAVDKVNLADGINLSYGSVPAWLEDGGEFSSSYNAFGPRGGAGIIPPGSSGSDVDEHPGRDRKNRQAEGSFSNGPPLAEGAGATKSLRNGKQARRFLSGIISRKRTTSPDHFGDGALVGTLRGRDRDRDRGRDQGREPGVDQPDRSQDQETECDDSYEREREANPGREKKEDRKEDKKWEKKDEKKDEKKEHRKRDRELKKSRGRAHKRDSSKDKSQSRGFVFSEPWGSSSSKGEAATKGSHTAA
ncbi:GTPase activating protein [Grosmannia clavigera kw1407]|uniref:GTPase activating protein n=1 Tax=Grosmannia clavigera (strain kw1407 / UAMH 11150) TaxID=655863 RepID=F0XDP0_GROCL|nr:GTPase activating protein [Grosmannia clavigera kw1407]EFX04052.1 GTPase activating protein [Grosmannia clavigera kw1407]